MATIATLCVKGELVGVGGGLDAHEQPERLLYALPHVIAWLDDVLPNLEPLLHQGRRSPLEQVDGLFHDFVSGADFAFYKRSHSMEPRDAGVWELKTEDVRFFGWFPKKGIFIVANCDSAFKCKEHDLYAGYRDDSVRRRTLLDLDEPKFIEGEYDDVL